MKRKKEIKFSVLKLNPTDKTALESKSSEIGMSMTQILVFGALRATQLDIPMRIGEIDSVQIRLPEPIHAELERMSKRTNRPMTELIVLGIEAAFDLKLKGSL